MPAWFVVKGQELTMTCLKQLDITVGSMKLDDQFEWDIDNTMTSPEQFAEIYAQELGLAGEFKYEISSSCC